MRTTRLLVMATAGLVVAGAPAACGDKARTTAAGATVAVTSTDNECKLDRTDLAAGANTFQVTNKGGKTTEFYVYAGGDKVVGEVENVAPGLTRQLTVELAAGEYEGACKPGMVGDGIRTKIKVSGAAKALTDDPKLAAAVAKYKEFVIREADALQAGTKSFVDAVKANDVATAKRLYPVARTHWERIENVAESFGDLDPAIDGREDGVEPGQEWTGYHRLEKDLWVGGDVSADGTVADKLLADVAEVVKKAKEAELNPLDLANGSKELLDEVASGKITGEEERYSHTDLWDFAANVDGVRVAVDALREPLTARDPALLAKLDEQVKNVDAALAKHRRGDGWRGHDELSQAELKDLSDAINALAEPISKIGAAITAPR